MAGGHRSCWQPPRVQLTGAVLNGTRAVWRGAPYRFFAAFLVAFLAAVFFVAFLAAFFAILPPWLAVLFPCAVIDTSLQVD